MREEEKREREKERKREEEKEKEREKEREREREKKERCARLHGGHLTRCGAHTPDVCAGPKSGNALTSEARPHNSDLIAIMTRELSTISGQSCNPTDVLTKPATRGHMVPTLPILQTLEISETHPIVQHRLQGFLPRDRTCCRRCPLSRFEQLDDRIELHEVPDILAPYFHPARDGGKLDAGAPYSYPTRDGGHKARTTTG